MSSVDAAVLLDGGAAEIWADGVGEIQVIGPVVKLVFYSVRLVGDHEEAREAVTVAMPWEALPGGLPALRAAFGDRVLPRLPMMSS